MLRHLVQNVIRRKQRLLARRQLKTEQRPAFALFHFEVFLRSTKGSRLPVEDYAIPADFESSMTVFGKSIKAIAESNPTYIFTSTSDPIRFRAGLGEFLSNEKPEIALGKKTNARTAAQYLETEKTLMASQWAAFMSQVS